MNRCWSAASQKIWRSSVAAGVTGRGPVPGPHVFAPMRPWKSVRTTSLVPSRLHEGAGVERERSGMAGGEVVRSPAFPGRAIDRHVDHLDDVVLRQQAGEIVESDREAAVDDLVGGRRPRLLRDVRVERDAADGPVEAAGVAHSLGRVDRRPGDVANGDLGAAGGAVHLGISVGGRVVGIGESLHRFRRRALDRVGHLLRRSLGGDGRRLRARRREQAGRDQGSADRKGRDERAHVQMSEATTRGRVGRAPGRWRPRRSRRHRPRRR